MSVFLRAWFQTSREMCSGINGSLRIRVIPGRTRFARVHVRKRCTGEPVREQRRIRVEWSKCVLAVSDAFSGPCGASAAILETKTSCRTITLNKSLPPIAIRCWSFTGCLCRHCLNKIKTTAATVSFGRRQEFIAWGDALPDY